MYNCQLVAYDLFHVFYGCSYLQRHAHTICINKAFLLYEYSYDLSIFDSKQNLFHKTCI